MSVQIFKDGECLLVDADYLQQHLDGGWSLEEEPTPEPEPAPPPPTQTPAPAPAPAPEPEAEAEDGGELTNQQIRDMARANGMENWESAQIRTLKASLGL